MANGSLTLMWAPNTEPDLASYKVYRGTSPGNYTVTQDVPAPLTVLTQTGLQDGVTYYFAITATDSFGNQSAKSQEINHTMRVPIVATLRRVA